MLSVLQILDFLGVSVFAISGALVASRKEMDLIGFGLMASVTGIGGGTLRDVLLDRSVFWIETPYYVAICLLMAVIVFFTAHILQRRYVAVLWADGIGIAAYAVMGADVALRAGANELVAIVMGVMTATFGGLIRDVICQQTSFILRKEIYATCVLAGASVYVGLVSIDTPVIIAAFSGFGAGFALRAGAILWGWTLPTYKPHPGREYK